MNAIYNSCCGCITAPFAVVSTSINYATKLVSTVASSVIFCFTARIFFSEEYDQRRCLQSFAKRVKNTQMSSVRFGSDVRPNQLGDYVKCLKGTQVTRVILTKECISAVGARHFALNLKDTNVTAVQVFGRLCDGNSASRTLIHYLKGTQVTSVHLNMNGIDDIAAREIAQNLKGTKVTALDLRTNDITEDGLIEFIRELSGTAVRKLQLTVRLTESCVKSILSLIPFTNLIHIDVGFETPNALQAACEENERRFVEAIRKDVESRPYKGKSQSYSDEITSVNDMLRFMPKEIRTIAFDAASGAYDFS